MLSQIQIKLPGRYPVKNSRYADAYINKRSPFYMPGELVIPASTQNRSYPEGTFLHSQDYPFEVTSMTLRVITLDSGGLPQADPNIGSLNNWVQISMKLKGIVRDMTKAPQRLASLLQSTTNGVVPFDEPLYLESSQGFDVVVNNYVLVGVAAGGINMAISFAGSLLELA